MTEQADNERAYQETMNEVAAELGLLVTSLAVRRRTVLLLQHRILTKAIIDGEVVSAAELLQLETALAESEPPKPPQQIEVHYVDNDAVTRALSAGHYLREYPDNEEGNRQKAEDRAAVEAEIERRVTARLAEMARLPPPLALPSPQSIAPVSDSPAERARTGEAPNGSGGHPDVIDILEGRDE